MEIMEWKISTLKRATFLSTLKIVFVLVGKSYFADLRMTFRQKYFLQDTASSLQRIERTEKPRL